MVVDDLNRMWVVDAQANELRVFDADGRFVRTIGRPGEGPSEFMRIGPVFHGPDRTIWVEDLTLVRWEVFDTSGTRIEGHRSESTLRGGWRQWTREGLFLVMEPHPRRPDAAALGVYHKTSDGALEREGRVLELPPEPAPSGVVTFESEYGSVEVDIPFAPQPFGLFGTNTDYWVSDGGAEDDNYQIHQVSLESGNRLLAIRRQFTPAPIPDSIRAAALESFRRETDGEGKPSVAIGINIIPRHYPPLHSFVLSGDGTLWVRRTFSDGLQGFDVFASNGCYLGRPVLSVEIGRMRVHSITATSIYAVDTDELGVNQVVRLDIERPLASLGDCTVPRVSGSAQPKLSEQARDPERPGTSRSPPDSSPDGAVMPTESSSPVFRDCPICPQMVVIPPGTFVMGSPSDEAGRDEDEGPTRPVTIPYSFAVGVYEVTFGEWDACMMAGGCPGNIPGDEAWGREDRPVINVSWDRAQSYVAWLSDHTGEPYRLPSEAEWEYITRGGTETARYWGETPGEQCRFANVYDQTGSEANDLGWVPARCSDGHAHTAPVGSFEPNAFGVHDTMGNVWEWTLDCWDGDYRRAPTDGSARQSGDCSGRIIRGGSWRSLARFSRSAGLRIYRARAFADNTIGLRVVRSVNGPLPRPMEAGLTSDKPPEILRTRHHLLIHGAALALHEPLLLLTPRIGLPR